MQTDGGSKTGSAKWTEARRKTTRRGQGTSIEMKLQRWISRYKPEVKVQDQRLTYRASDQDPAAEVNIQVHS